MKVCQKCGFNIDDDINFCPKCGNDFSVNYQIEPEATSKSTNIQTNGFAIASLVIGIIGVVSLGIAFIPQILAIIFALLAMGKIKNSQGVQKGKGLAITGIILGLIGLLIGTFYIIGIISDSSNQDTLQSKVSSKAAISSNASSNSKMTPQVQMSLFDTYLKSHDSNQFLAIYNKADSKSKKEMEGKINAEYISYVSKNYNSFQNKNYTAINKINADLKFIDSMSSSKGISRRPSPPGSVRAQLTHTALHLEICLLLAVDTYSNAWEYQWK